jgi:hypothetical protein
MPEFVKAADLDDLLQPEGLGRHQYADPAQLRFPCHTREATWLSTAYFAEAVSGMRSKEAAEIADNLEKFARYWQILPLTEKVLARGVELREQDFSKLADDQFAYVKRSDVQLERRLPLRNGPEVKAAGDWLGQWWPEFTWKDRKTIAEKILKKAEEFAVALERDDDDRGWRLLQKLAAQGGADPEKLANAILARVHLLARERQQPAAAEVLRKIAMTVRATPQFSLGGDALETIAEGIDALDREHGFIERYARGELTPIHKVAFELLYADLEAANQKLAVVGDHLYRTEELEQVPNAMIRERMGPEFAEKTRSAFHTDAGRLEKAAAELSEGDARRLRQTIEEAGAAPEYRNRRQKVGFTREALQQLARYTPAGR